MRKHSRHAWLLHGWMIASMILMPFSRTVHGEDDPPPEPPPPEPEWSFTSQTQLELELTAPDGTSNLVLDESYELETTLWLHYWEVWSNRITGQTEIREDTKFKAGGTLNFSSPEGMAVFSESNVGTSGDYTNNVILNGDWGDEHTIMVEASWSGRTATAQITMQAGATAETWQVHHDEGLIHASIGFPAALNPGLGSASPVDNLTEGLTRVPEVTVTYTSWNVETSSYGRTRTTAPVTSTAGGAEVVWSVENDTSENIVPGSVSNADDYTSAQGKAQATFTMGSSAATLRADISYGGSHSTNASVTFNPPPPPPPQWIQIGDDYTEYALGVVQPGGTTEDVGYQEQRTITGTLLAKVYGIFELEDGSGEREWRHLDTTAAALLDVEVTLESGAGLSHSGLIMTDDNGNFSTTFTMGGQTGIVRVAVPGSSDPGNPEKEVYLYYYPQPEVWTRVDEDGSATELTLIQSETSEMNISCIPGSTTTLQAKLRSVGWDNYVSNYGNTKGENYRYVNIPNYPVTIRMEQGDGSLRVGTGLPGTEVTAVTNASGIAQISYTMGSEDSIIRAFIGAEEDSITTYMSAAVEPESYTHHHDEAVISIALTANGTTTGVPNGAVRTVTGHVTYENWQIWTSNYGNTDRRFDSGGAAINAAVNFSKPTGDGHLLGLLNTSIGGSTLAYTDDNGDVSTTFTMAIEDTKVRMRVDFAGSIATADLDFLAAPWVKTGNGTALDVTMSSNAAAAKVFVNVMQEFWEDWTNGGTPIKFNKTRSAAIGASVSLSIASGSLETSTGTTNSSGRMTTEYEISQSTTATADVSFNGLAGQASTSLSPYDGGGGDYPDDPPPPPENEPPTGGGAGTTGDRLVFLGGGPQWRDDGNDNTAWFIAATKIKGENGVPESPGSFILELLPATGPGIQSESFRAQNPIYDHSKPNKPAIPNARAEQWTPTLRGYTSLKICYPSFDIDGEGGDPPVDIIVTIDLVNKSMTSSHPVEGKVDWHVVKDLEGGGKPISTN
jgi:hypothetical protein